MGLLKKLGDLFLQQDIDKSWIPTEKFALFLNTSGNDRCKRIKPSDVHRLASIPTKLFEGKQYINKRSVLKFIFAHSHSNSVCDEIANDIADAIFETDDTEPEWETSRLDVYRKLLQSCIFESLSSDILNLTNISNFSFSADTLIYQDLFSEDEWRKICVFECNLALCYPEFHSKSPLQQDEVRWAFLELCISAQQVSSSIAVICKDIVKHRKLRQQCAESIDGVQIECMVPHIPKTVDYDIIHHVENRTGISIEAICVDHPSSVQQNFVIVFIEMQRSLFSFLHTVSNCIDEILLEFHHVRSQQVYLEEGLLHKYRINAEVTRFSLRDDYLAGKLQSDITKVCHSELDDDISATGHDKCVTCFPPELPKPLSMDNFQIFEEWLLDVPLPIQGIFQAFINKRSLEKSEGKTFLSKKLKRLYLFFDGLLNTYNRNHMGILQIANTDELMMHHKSVTTVFDITGSAGVTRSFKHAERLLYPDAVEDYVYYNTFIRGTPVTYQTDAGLVTKAVKLKDSEIVIIIDNLHRLLSRSDPQPDESRIGQLNTLQITLQAIPKDSSSVLNMHTSDCDNKVDCVCKQKSCLGRNEVSKILDCSAEENQMYQNALQLITWGNSAMWRTVDQNGELGRIIQDLSTRYSEEDDRDHVCGQVFVPFDEVQTGSHGNEVQHDESTIQLCTILSNSKNQIIDSSNLLADLQSGDEDSNDSLSDIEPLENAEFLTGFFQGMSGTNLEESFGNMTLDDIIDGNFPSEPSKIMDSVSNTLCEVGAALNDFEVTEAISISGRKELATDSSENAGTATDGPIHLEKESYCSSDSPPVEASRKQILQLQGAEPGNFNIKQTKAPNAIFYKHLTKIGRDDDIEKLKQILTDLQAKLCEEPHETTSDRILFGGDHKLANNLVKLMSSHGADFSKFLPIPPVLHLRKSRINTLFSTYEAAGIVQILQVMRNDDRKDWTMLAGKDHIDMATQNVRRIALAIQMALQVMFSLTLSLTDRKQFLDSLHSGSTTESQSLWDAKYQNFLQKCSSQNATFRVHLDMLKYCNIIVTIKLAERMGGKEGFLLLLTAVKKSLPWSFLNGATCYGPFCVHLLHAYYSSSVYHQNLVHVMWSTPIKNGTVNHGPDTKRELFHQDATPAIRTSRSEKAVTTRLAKLDYFTKVHELQITSRKNYIEEETESAPDRLSWHLTESDVAHIHKGAALVVTQFVKHNLCDAVSDTPMNIYNKDVPLLLHHNILVSETTPVLGNYMVMKYIAKKELMGLTEHDLPDLSETDGPQDLIKKIIKCKSDTIKCTSSAKASCKSVDEVAEEQRQKSINKEVKKLQGLSSKMNTCLALVNQDCSKRTIRKSTGMSLALSKLKSFTSADTDSSQHIHLAQHNLPAHLRNQVVFVAMEFAGVKFKVDAQTGQEFLTKLESCGITPILSQLKNVSTLIICEEKYSHTPDKMKGPTRQSRQSQSSSIAHLIHDNEILSDASFNKVAIQQTQRGRQMASNYLAANVARLKIQRHLILVVDSDLSTEGCTCGTATCCCSDRYSTPLKFIFSPDGFVTGSKTKMAIKQRKGEGEMAVADWLLWFVKETLPKKNECVAAVISSGDIDAVVIMLYMVAHLWPRNEEGTFSSEVYVILQKPSKLYDTYCITGILNEMETVFQSKQIGMVIAVSLCIGGNDFLTGFRNKSHSKVLLTILEHKNLWQNLLDLSTTESIKLSQETFILLVKHLYSSRSTNPSTIPYNTLQQSTISAKSAKSTNTIGIMVNNPGTWLPPKSSLLKLASLIDWQIQYLETAGRHDAKVPCSSQCSCIVVKPSGVVTYDFGPDAHITDISDFVSRETPKKPKTKRKKRPLSRVATPQKASRKRIVLQSTPKTKY